MSRYVAGNLLGSPEEVAEQLRPYEATGVQHLGLVFIGKRPGRAPRRRRAVRQRGDARLQVGERRLIGDAVLYALLQPDRAWVQELVVWPR